MEKRKHAPNIAADPIGAVLILAGPPETNTAPAILLRADGSATALHAIPGADGVWSLSDPIEQLTPEKVRQCFLGMSAIRREAANEIERLIALLDRLGPDPDLEENGDNDADASEDEPSLGSCDNFTNQTHWSANSGHAERETDLEAEHDGSEPTLGAAEPLELDPQQALMWCGEVLPPTEEDRASVYDQSSWGNGGTEYEQDAGDERELEDHV